MLNQTRSHWFWSPDGKKIAFSFPDFAPFYQGDYLGIVKLPSGEFYRIRMTRDQENILQDWAADSRSVVVLVKSGQASSLIRVPVPE